MDNKKPWVAFIGEPLVTGVVCGLVLGFTVLHLVIPAIDNWRVVERLLAGVDYEDTKKGDLKVWFDTKDELVPTVVVVSRFEIAVEVDPRGRPDRLRFWPIGVGKGGVAVPKSAVIIAGDAVSAKRWQTELNGLREDFHSIHGHPR